MRARQFEQEINAVIFLVSESNFSGEKNEQIVTKGDKRELETMILNFKKNSPIIFYKAPLVSFSFDDLIGNSKL